MVYYFGGTQLPLDWHWIRFFTVFSMDAGVFCMIKKWWKRFECVLIINNIKKIVVRVLACWWKSQCYDHIFFLWYSFQILCNDIRWPDLVGRPDMNQYREVPRSTGILYPFFFIGRHPGDVHRCQYHHNSGLSTCFPWPARDCLAGFYTLLSVLGHQYCHCWWWPAMRFQIVLPKILVHEILHKFTWCK